MRATANYHLLYHSHIAVGSNDASLALRDATTRSRMTNLLTHTERPQRQARLAARMRRYTYLYRLAEHARVATARHFPTA